MSKKNSQNQKQQIINQEMRQHKQFQFNLSSQDRTNITQQEYNYQFYQEYKKIYQTTLNLSKQVHQLLERKSHAWFKLGEYQKRAEEFKDNIRGEPPQKKKRSRRTADQIQRQYVCEVQRCHRCYGTEGSLYQHIKLKHPKIYADLKQKNGGISHSISQNMGQNDSDIQEHGEQSIKEGQDSQN